MSSGILQRQLQVDEVGQEEDTKVNDDLLINPIPSLLSGAASELFSLEVCRKCTSRVLGDTGFINGSSSSLLWRFNDASSDLGCGAAEPWICRVCFGILQLVYLNEEGAIVKLKGYKELAALVIEMVKKEGHCFDMFSLELSLPRNISESEQQIRTYMKNKYASEPWYVVECMSVKEALKHMISSALEEIPGVRYGGGSICIRFTYNQSNTLNNGVGMKKTGINKKLKTGNETDRPFCEEKINSNSLDSFNREKVVEPCHLVIGCYRPPVRFGGRYLKLSRNVSQTRWIIDDERMGEASVEEIIGTTILPTCEGDDYKFHAAGREDIDVRMLGSGRPFLLEIHNPRKLPSPDAVKDMQTKINTVDHNLVAVKNLRIVDSDAWTLMQEGEAQKQKQYCALVWISRPLEDTDTESISSIIDLRINQKTPIRVLHRRSPLER